MYHTAYIISIYYKRFELFLNSEWSTEAMWWILKDNVRKTADIMSPSSPSCLHGDNLYWNWPVGGCQLFSWSVRGGDDPKINLPGCQCEARMNKTCCFVLQSLLLYCNTTVEKWSILKQYKIVQVMRLHCLFGHVRCGGSWY